MKKKTLQLALVAVLFLTGCKNNVEKNETGNYQTKGDTVYVHSPLLAEKLKIADAIVQPYSKEIITAGTIQAIPTQFAYIAPPFAGRVIKSYIKLGQNVKQNTPLFEINSPDFTAAQKEFFQAQASKELALKDYRRKEDLLKNGVSSLKEMEEAENALLLAEKEYENTVAALKVYQIDDPERMVLGQPLIVRSPITGNIIENNIVTGQYLKDDSEPIAVVANLNEVWVTAQVKEKDIRFIEEGSNLNIEISAFPGKQIEGTVYHIDEAVDETTRSIRVLSVCNNKEGMLRLGMYATVHFHSTPEDAIYISEKALLQGEKDSYVFVEASPGTYVRKPVEVETTKNGLAVITGGLSIGDRIMCEGGYYLK